MWPSLVLAQVGPTPVRTSGTLSAASSDVTSGCPATACVDLNVSGYASVSFQVTGTWSATITFEGSVDAVNYKTLNVTTASASGSSTTTTTNNIFTGAVGGMSHARARVSAYTSGSPVVSILAALSGGGSGGGGGTSSAVTIQDPSVSSQKAAVNASGQLSITCANCSGSGASAVDTSAFTAGATSGAPMMGFFHSTIDTVTDGTTAVIGMDTNRNAFQVIRDAAGNARGANVDASSRLNVTMNSGSVLSGAFASGALASGSVSSGAIASGAVASGAIASGAVASGAFASGAISDGADVTLGAKADAKSTATDTTAVTAMQVLKEISAMEQVPASRAVTNAGTFATQSAITAASGSIQSGAIASGAIASGAIASGAVASGAVASGAYASGSISDGADVTLGAKGDAKSTATDTTAITIMQVLKEISAMEQAPASRAVTNAGTFADQATLQTQTDTVMVGGVNVKEINAVTPLMGNGVTGTGSLRVTVASDNTPFQNSPVATATTTNATATCYHPATASTNSTNCKASAGNVYAIHVTNTSTTNYFVRMYDASSAPTCSSATGFIETIPALGATANGGVNGRVNVVPQAYATGIGFCITGGSSSTDNTNAAAGVFLTIEYF